MRLKEAFNILKPNEPSYEAFKIAHQDFIKKYQADPNAEALLQLGQAAYSTLIEKDVFVFCDYDRYSQEVTSETSIVTEIQHRLQELQQFQGIHTEVRGIWLWVSGETEEHEAKLQRLGFEWKSKKKQWAWRPSALN